MFVVRLNQEAEVVRSTVLGNFDGGRSESVPIWHNLLSIEPLEPLANFKDNGRHNPLITIRDSFREIPGIYQEITTTPDREGGHVRFITSLITSQNEFQQ